MTAPYGYCPVCGAAGVNRERRPDGNDTCEGGHVYPSRAALHDSCRPGTISIAELKHREPSTISHVLVEARVHEALIEYVEACEVMMRGAKRPCKDCGQTSAVKRFERVRAKFER